MPVWLSQRGCPSPRSHGVRVPTRGARLPAVRDPSEQLTAYLRREAVIASTGSTSPASLAYTEQWLPEDAPLLTARQRAEEVGCVPVTPGVGAALRFLAAAVDARTVVEIGTGTGVSGTWLLRGMRADGVLTSVDIAPDNQRYARQALVEAGFAANRARLITGRALDVLPRLSDAAYDLVFADAAKPEYAEYLAEALRLLRPGGVVAFDNALWHDRVADPAVRDEETAAIRHLGELVREDPRLIPVLLPVGDGLLAAVTSRS